MNDLLKKYGKYMVYLFAAAVVILNVSLIFDNVVWGDEAFSANAIRNDVHGILQISFYLDSHPPLYYLWLKLVATIFGYHIWAYHLASIIPFLVGIVLAVTVLRKKFGNLAAISFVILSGLAAPCSEYNQEIRMYELCFMAIFICAIMSYQIFEKNTGFLAWVLLTFFGLIAGYSHYYGLVTSGILLFVTGVLYFIRNKGKTWLYGTISIVAYLVLYSPWLVVLSKQMNDVKNGWWATEVEKLNRLFSVIFCGKRIQWLLLFVILALFVFVIMTECGKFSFGVEKSSAFYAMICFISTQILVLLFGYGISFLLSPIMVIRYMYPLVPLTLFNLMIGISRIVKYKDVMKYSVCGFLVIILCLALWDFKDYRSTVKSQDAVTRETLNIIGQPEEGTVFMSTGVQHLSFTVLQYYYPNFEVLGVMGGSTEEIDDSICTNLWRFINEEESGQTIQTMKQRGYDCQDLGIGHLGKYSFFWYHYTKN